MRFKALGNGLLLFVWGCVLFLIFFEMKFEISANVVLGLALGMKELVMDR